MRGDNMTETDTSMVTRDAPSGRTGTRKHSQDMPPDKRQDVKAANLAAEAIRSRILDSLLSPGQRLIEAELMAELDVGRSTIREAFLRLESDGLVELRHQRGAMVRRLSRRDMAELFEIRERLEGLGAALCASRASGQSQIRAQLRQARRHWSEMETQGNALRHMQDNVDFHRDLIEMSGNARLLRTLAPMQIPGYRMQFIQLMDDRHCAISATEHVAIIDAMLAGDATEAERLMRHHVRRAGELAQSISGLVD